MKNRSGKLVAKQVEWFAQYLKTETFYSQDDCKVLVHGMMMDLHCLTWTVNFLHLALVTRLYVIRPLLKIQNCAARLIYLNLQKPIIWMS